MLLKSVVIIVIRLFAIQWLVYAIAPALAMLGFGSGGLFVLAPMLLYLFFSAIAWIAAPIISDLVTKNCESTVNLNGLSREDLYAFGFVVLGLYFVLSSIGPTINLLYAQFIMGATIYNESARIAMHSLAPHLITFVAGLVTLFTGHLWARKLAWRDAEANEPPSI